VTTNIYLKGQVDRLPIRDSLITVLSTKPDDSFLLVTQHRLAMWYAIRKPDSALYWLNKSIERAEQVGMNDLLANLLYDKGRVIYQVKRDQTAGLKLYRSALSIGNTETRIKCLQVIGSHHRNHGGYDSALFYYEKSLDLIVSLSDESRLANYYQTIGFLQRSKGNLSAALNNQLKAVEIFERSMNMKFLAIARINLSDYYVMTAQYAQALACLQQVILYNEKSTNEPGLAHAYIRMASVYKKSGDLEKAISYTDLAVSIRKKLNDLAGLANSYNFMAELHLISHAPLKAIESLRRAIRFNSKDKRLDEMLTSFYTMGKAYLELGNLDSSTYYFQRTLEIGQEKENRNFEFAGLIGLARIDTTRHLWKSAIDRSKEALTIAISGGDLKKEYDLFLILHQASARLGDFQNAYSYYKSFKKASDSLYSTQKSREFGEIAARLDHEKELEKIKFENQRRELELKAEVLREKYLGLAGSVFLLIVLGFGFYRYRSKARLNKRLSEKNRLIKNQSLEIAQSAEKEKILLTQQIKSKDRELALYAMQFQERNNMLVKLEDKLIEIGNSSPNKKEISQLKRLIKSNLNEKEAWSNFINKFGAVYPNFFEKMKSNYDELTLNQLKISAYIKVGMDNGDIAQVTHTEISSVKKNVNRMKKKMKLTAKESIRDFLITYS
jgi:tetratricopeptide (TPR) repeat protein